MNKTSKKDKAYFVMLVVGVVLIVMALANKGDKGVNPLDKINEKPNQSNSASQDKNNASVNVLEGMLRYSDDPTRGNLKLVSVYSDIYIRTSRDFSNLVGLEVLARINGTLDKFELISIEPKVAKDGYIHQQ